MPTFLLSYILVFFGGGLGAAARHGVNRLALIYTPDYPLGTLFINVLGCFTMGLLTAWFTFRGEDSSQHLRLFLTTGVLGGFTTFSAFSLDAALLWERGEQVAMLAYSGASLLLTIVAVFTGLALGRALFA